jgi:hypothetical protein
MTKAHEDFASNAFWITPAMVHFTGSLSSAVFLQTCLHWQQWAEKQGRNEFWKTATEWKRDYGLSRDQVDGARSLFEPCGILTTWVERTKERVATFYQVDIEKLNKFYLDHLKTGHPLKRLTSKSNCHKDAPTHVGKILIPPCRENPHTPMSGKSSYPYEENPHMDVGEILSSSISTDLQTDLQTKNTSQDARAEEIDRRERTRSNGGGEGDLSQLASSESEPEAGTESLSLPAKPRAIALPPVKPLREGQEVPPPAAPKIQNFHHSAVENFDTRWHRPDVPWYDKATRKFHDALIGSYALSYASIALLPNGQPNLPKIHRILANKLNSQDGIAELNLLWEQAQLGGNAPTQFAALADRLPKESGLAQGIALIANMPRRERRAAL